MHAFCHAVPGTVARDGRDALGRGLAAVAARAPGADDAVRRTSSPRPPAWGPGVEGLLFAPYLAGERTPHADPDARGAFTGLAAAPRPWRARARRARGRRLRPARLARARCASSASRPTVRASRAAARAETSGCTIVASVLDLPIERPRSTRAPRSAPRCSAASPAASSPTCPTPSSAACASATSSSPTRPGSTVYARRPSALSRALPRTRHAEGASTMNDFEGKVAVVTGASRGIGAAVAHALARAGRRASGSPRAPATTSALGAPLALPTDVRDRAQVQALVDATVERFGGIDIVVANAGVGAYGPFVELDADHLDEMIDTNVKGVLYVAARDGSAPDRARRRRLRLRRLGGGPSRSPERGRLLRLEVRAGRASRGRSTTSCARTGSAARTSARAASRPTSRSTTTAAAPRGWRRWRG